MTSRPEGLHYTSFGRPEGLHCTWLDGPEGLHYTSFGRPEGLHYASLGRPEGLHYTSFGGSEEMCYDPCCTSRSRSAGLQACIDPPLQLYRDMPRISGTLNTRTPRGGGLLTACSSAFTIAGRVTRPRRSAPSRVDGHTRRSAYTGTSRYG